MGRALRGDWAGAVQAALWPVGLVLFAAVALAIPSYGQDSGDVVVGFGDRMRLALAVLLQGVGGGLELSAGGGSGGGVPAYGGSDYGSGDYGPGGSGTAAISVVPLLVTVLWIVALVIGTRMLRSRLYARIVPGAPDGATGGLEAAVRVAVATTLGTLALALFAQPDIAEVSVSSAPFLTALWTLLLALVVAGGVLHADDLRYRVAAARPGLRMTVGAFGTAVRAMGLVLVVALVLGWIGLAIFGEGGGSPSDLGEEEFGGSEAAGVGTFLMLLPNFALAVLGLCWGGSLEVEARGTSGFGGGYEKEAFGLSRLGDELGSGSVVYALGVGLVCALLVGVVAARRSADRREQLLSAGLFFGLLLLLAGIGGLGAEFRGDIELLGTGAGQFDLGLNVPEVLLFGLLWVGGAAFVGPHVARALGLTPTPTPPAPGPYWPPMPPAPAASPMPAPPAIPEQSPQTPQTPQAPQDPPGQAPVPLQKSPQDAPDAQAPQQPDQSQQSQQSQQAEQVQQPQQTPHTPFPAPAPAPQAPYDLHTVGLVAGPPQPQPPRNNRRRAWIWAGTLVGALVIGGGSAAGVVLLHDDGGSAKKDDAKGASAQSSPSAQASQESQESPDAQESADASAATPSDPAAATATGEPTDMPTVPAGYHQVFDELGFSFVVPEVWERQGVKNGSQVTYAGSTGMSGYLVGVIPDAGYTSYDNMLLMEKRLKADKNKKDYQRVQLERNTFQGRAGARWEYTYEDASGATVHAVDQAYVAAGGTEYAILLTAPESDWTSAQEMYRIALDSWRLTDTD
ncbi:hypothetical protein [Streptomyces sp. NPDC050145]|uniref:hypothetical protein n=1 Tax=Streptomyces sp. NPDC050145 TaxID=3365602 RepID=UPI00378F39FA